MNPRLKIIVIFFFILCSYNVFSQTCSDLNFKFQYDIPSVYNEMTVTMIHDELDRRYLYVANKEGGLKIYLIPLPASPFLLATVPISNFENLEVMSVSQNGNYLYLALGNTFITPQRGGIAIVDITEPSNPVVTDYYVVPGPPKGGGIVVVEGDYAYLGAMASGLIILDIRDKNNIQFVSQFIPDIKFPPISKPDTLKINARGMEVKNSIVYLCYDAGGFRIIDCTNKFKPIETGRYCNPEYYIPFNRPRAYNNVVLDYPYAYTTVDYCGLEVLDNSDPANIKLHGWWNPYGCPDNNWFGSPSHTNEIQFDRDCNLLFIASGKSDMMVLDISNPAQPDSCNFYGGVSNDIGTWGIDLYKGQIFLSYICSPLWPFQSNWTGVKFLTYSPCANFVDDQHDFDFIIYPNPASQEINIQLPDQTDKMELIIYNSVYQIVKTYSDLNDKLFSVVIKEFSNGLYFFQLKTGKRQAVKKLFVEN